MHKGFRYRYLQRKRYVEIIKHRYIQGCRSRSRYGDERVCVCVYKTMCMYVDIDVNVYGYVDVHVDSVLY